MLAELANRLVDEVDKLRGDGYEEPLTAEALAERIGDIAPREDEF